jgi:hypothetical protein
MAADAPAHWEERMSQDALDTDRIVRLLLEDAVGTLGERASAEVLDCAAWREVNARDQVAHGASLEEAQSYFDREVVDQFQQAVHDLFWDTTWPACPWHPNHPLWYDEDHEAWCCPRDGSPIAPLGGLANVARRLHDDA